MVDGARGHEESIPDRGVTEPVGDHRENLELPRREQGWVPARGRPRAARKATRSALAQSPRYECCCARRAELDELLVAAPHEAVVVAHAEHESGIVGAAETRPTVRRTLV